MPVEKVQRLKDAAQAITSLDAPIGDDGAALQDLVEDEVAVGPDELAVEAVGREALEQVLAALPERQQVLILRLGWRGHPRTLEEVGAVMGISRERARQLERATLAVLRGPRSAPAWKTSPPDGTTEELMRRGRDHDVPDSPKRFHQVLYLWVMAWCGPLPTVGHMTVQADQQEEGRNS